MEKIQNFVENSLGNSQKFENLQEELMDYQFQYVEKLQNKTLKPLHEKVEGYEETFDDYILEYTNFRPYLNDEYCKRMGDESYHDENKEKEFNDWIDSVKEEIIIENKLDKNNYRKKIGQIIKTKLNELESIPKEDNRYLQEKHIEERAGLIHFNTTKALNEFTEFGINEGDDCISIHFKDLIDQKSKDNKVVNIFSGESLTKLAEIIVEKYPETKAILAQSWIVGSPLGRRVGFTPSKRIDSVVPDTRFWGQFINEKGEINKERMNQFLKSGVPEFFITDGFIRVEDFLRKYLPEYKKENVILKEASVESDNFQKDIDRIKQELNEKWNEIPYLDMLLIFNSNKVLSRYFETQDGLEFLKMIKVTKESHKSLNDFEYENKDIIRNNLDQYIKDHKNSLYKDKIVDIKR